MKGCSSSGSMQTSSWGRRLPRYGSSWETRGPRPRPIGAMPLCGNRVDSDRARPMVIPSVAGRSKTELRRGRAWGGSGHGPCRRCSATACCSARPKGSVRTQEMKARARKQACRECSPRSSFDREGRQLPVQGRGHSRGRELRVRVAPELGGPRTEHRRSRLGGGALHRARPRKGRPGNMRSSALLHAEPIPARIEGGPRFVTLVESHRVLVPMSRGAKCPVPSAGRTIPHS